MGKMHLRVKMGAMFKIKLKIVFKTIKEVAIRRYTQSPPYWFHSCVSTDTGLSVDTPIRDIKSDNKV